MDTDQHGCFDRGPREIRERNFWFGFLQKWRAYGAGKNVAAGVIFAELLKAENFMQSRPDATRFLTRISRINAN
jgi:hypothetical protein